VSQVRATEEAKEVGLVDLALVTTKSYDLEGAGAAFPTSAMVLRTAY